MNTKYTLAGAFLSLSITLSAQTAASGEAFVALNQTPVYMEASTNTPVVGIVATQTKVEIIGIEEDASINKIADKSNVLGDNLYIKIKSGSLTGYIPRYYLKNEGDLAKLLAQRNPAPEATKEKGGKGKKGK